MYSFKDQIPFNDTYHQYIDYSKTVIYKGLDVLIQCCQITWDGDIISPTERNNFVEKGYITRVAGFNIITVSGINCLRGLGILRS